MILSIYTSIAIASLGVNDLAHLSSLYVKSNMGRSVFKVETPSHRVIGTAFLVGPGLVITNHHVCLAAKDPSGRVGLLQEVSGNRDDKAKVRRLGIGVDLCLIDTNSFKDTQHFLLAKAGAFKAHDWLFTIGHPEGEELSVSFGRNFFLLSSLKPIFSWEDTKKDIISGVMDIAVHPGQSGSPILNTKGNVVGVVYGYLEKENVGLFVPLTEIRMFLKGKKDANKSRTNTTGDYRGRGLDLDRQLAPQGSYKSQRTRKGKGKSLETHQSQRKEKGSKKDNLKIHGRIQ